MSDTSRPRPKRPLHRRTETFVVRVWAEYLEQTPPAWRGEIERVGSGEVIRFSGANQILALIEDSISKAEQEAQT
jgi:hypothetical protein